MPGIHPSVAIHKSSIDPMVKLVKQKRRKFDLERTESIQHEVEKLLEVGLIEKQGILTG